MAEEFKVLIGAELKAGDFDAIKNQLQNIQTKPIKLTIDSSNVNQQINSIKQQLQSLSKIKINLSGNGNNGIQNSVNSMNLAYKQMLSIQKQASSMSLKMNGLNANSNEFKELSLQFARLKSDYATLKNTFGQSLSTTQWGNLQAVVTETDNKLALLDAKVADTKAKLAENITLKLNTSEFDKGVSTLETNFNKLKTQTVEVTTGMTEVKAALSDMKVAASNGDINGLISGFERYNAALKSTTNQVAILTQEEQKLASAEKLQQAQTNLSLQMDVWLKNNSAAASQFGSRVQQLKSELQSCDATRLSGIKSEFQAITREAELAGKNTQSFGDRLQTQMSKLGVYFSAAMVFTQATRAVKSMYDNVVEVDTAMTELYRVSDLSASQYNSLYDDMTVSAKQYGSTLSDIINSTASWVRLGFDTGESERLSEITAMYQHVTDLDNGTAVENLVTAYKGFQNQLLDLYDGDSTAAIEYVADVFDKLGNEYAVSAADVGEALTKCSSAMDVAGNSLQETSAMATGITEVTQNADKAGSALKILSMRLRGTEAKELQDMGEDTDGLIENTGKLEEKIKELSGVEIMADDGSFKSTYDIMNDIAHVWDGLSDTNQAALLETIAGKQKSYQYVQKCA